MSGVIDIDVFGGGACGSCPRVQVDVVTGALATRAEVDLPRSRGEAPVLNYAYSNLYTTDGVFGYGRLDCGTPGMKLKAYDSYGRVYITRSDGSRRFFLWSSDDSVYEPDTTNGEHLRADNQAAPSRWWHSLPDGTYYVYDGSGAGSPPAVPYYAYDPNGACTYYAYDASRRMTRIDDPSGHSTYYFGHD